MDRIAMLSEILTANPEDSFARYGLAQEYSNAGQTEQALQEFKTLIEKNPDYTPAYFMPGPRPAKTNRPERAKRKTQRQCPRAIRDDGHAGRTGVRRLQRLEVRLQR